MSLVAVLVGCGSIIVQVAALTRRSSTQSAAAEDTSQALPKLVVSEQNAFCEERSIPNI